MRFLVDAQLPRAICDMLSYPDHEAVHVKDVLPVDAADADIWRLALANGQALVTKDEDFARRLQSGAKGPQIVWIRLGNCSNPALRLALEPLWPLVCDALEAGEPIVEIR
jgi:predicted nuclease of predicted toxin-antitoxin system